jgi:hypothetical protein
VPVDKYSSASRRQRRVSKGRRKSRVSGPSKVEEKTSALRGEHVRGKAVTLRCEGPGPYVKEIT